MRNAKATSHRTSSFQGGLTAPLTLTLGWNQSCALIPDGTALCWGANSSAQLGTGTADLARHNRPSLVAAPLALVSLSAGARHTCAVGLDGVAYRNTFWAGIGSCGSPREASTRAG